MTIQVEHRLSKETAKQRVEELIENNREQYNQELQNLVVEWREYRAHIRLQARGYSSAGNIEVTDNAVELDFYLPFLLQVFGKKIRSVVQGKLEESLA
jgi:hypothetical protein